MSLSEPYYTLQAFVQVSPSFHQVCSSDFVILNVEWVKIFSAFIFKSNFTYNDFRIFLVPQFRGLASLCTIAQVTISDGLLTFQSNTLISKRAESNATIQSQVTSVLSHFHSSTSDAFILMLDYVKDIAKGNRMITAILSNWYLGDHITKADITGINPTLLPRSYANGTCICDGNSKCLSALVIDGWVVPGFRVGCDPMESFLESTLECLYNATCIDMIMPHGTTANMTFQALDSTLSSINATVQSLVDVLMIDRWKKKVMYEDYYRACAPLYCIYSLDIQFDKVYVFTTIMGLSGGCTVALKLIIPLFVQIWKHTQMYRRRLVQPMGNAIA